MARESFCHNADGSEKNTYRTRHKARTVARLASSNLNHKVKPYRCPSCGSYHLGGSDSGHAA